MKLPQAWAGPLAGAVATPSFARLTAFLEEERRNQPVLPPEDQVFRALELTAPHEVRVVLLGQDPYPTKGNANGLAFSVAPGVKVPASLKNIFVGLQRELGLPLPSHGDLTAWARRGVLLLNTVLTVREGTPQSHRKKGWEDFTRAVLSHVAAQPRTVVFLCLGKPAQALVASLNTAQPQVHAPHPSPLNGSAFVDTVEKEKIFTRVAELLGEKLNWTL